jgi:hypothetical protein
MNESAGNTCIDNDVQLGIEVQKDTLMVCCAWCSISREMNESAGNTCIDDDVQLGIEVQKDTLMVCCAWCSIDTRMMQAPCAGTDSASIMVAARYTILHAVLLLACPYTVAASVMTHF